MSSRIAEGLQADSLAVSECMKRDAERIETFLNCEVAAGEERRPVLFFYGVREHVGKPGQSSDKSAAPAPVHVFCSGKHDAEGAHKIEEKCVYFLRTKNRPVVLKNGSDETVLAGELSSNILPQFETTLSKVGYLPFGTPSAR